MLKTLTLISSRFLKYTVHYCYGQSPYCIIAPPEFRAPNCYCRMAINSKQNTQSPWPHPEPMPPSNCTPCLSAGPPPERPLRIPQEATGKALSVPSWYLTQHIHSNSFFLESHPKYVATIKVSSGPESILIFHIKWLCLFPC